jgi:hypothetical protein
LIQFSNIFPRIFIEFSPVIQLSWGLHTVYGMLSLVDRDEV